MVRDFLNIEKNHGKGEKSELSKSKLDSLQRVCDPFRILLERNCTNYALYRCTLTSDGDTIYAVLSGSDDAGNMSEIQFGYNMLTKETYTRKIKVKEEAKLGKELYNLVINLINLVPFSVGMLDFPVEGKFKEGCLMEYNKEPGTCLIIIKDSLDNSYFLS